MQILTRENSIKLIEIVFGVQVKFMDPITEQFNIYKFYYGEDSAISVHVYLRKLKFFHIKQHFVKPDIMTETKKLNKEKNLYETCSVEIFVNGLLNLYKKS